MGGRVERAVSRLRDLEGDRPTAVLSRVAWTAWLALRREPPEPWLVEKARVDRAFDGRFAVDTGGVTRLGTLRIDCENRHLGVDHIASDPGELNRALDSLPPDLDRFTLVDLGSGKGRAVLIAAQRPFRRIIGVEFSRALHRVALENLDRFPSAERRCPRVELTCADAATYELPREDLVLFMYNPFGREVMRQVAASVRDSLRDAPRRLFVLYTSPVHADVWSHTGFEELKTAESFALFRPPRTAGAHLRLLRSA